MTTTHVTALFPPYIYRGSLCYDSSLYCGVDLSGGHSMAHMQLLAEVITGLYTTLFV